MIPLTIDGRTFEIERESIEARLQEAIAKQTAKLSELNPLLRSTIKGAADIFLIQLGHKPPKGVDKLEYLAAYVAHVGLNALEAGGVLTLQGKEIVKENEENETDDR